MNERRQNEITHLNRRFQERVRFAREPPSRWMDSIDRREKEVLTLGFVEECEYHEIAAAQKIPIGTVQFRLFSAKRKPAPLPNRAGTLLE